MSLFPFRKKPALSAVEAYVLREFPAAVAFAAQEWKGYDGYFRRVDPNWQSNSLALRFAGFLAGPIAASLAERFPQIAVVGGDADAKMNLGGHKDLLIAMIASEGVIASGTDGREAVRALRSAAATGNEGPAG
jgi:hypothetical protein